MCDIGFQVKCYAVKTLLGDSYSLVEKHLVKLVLEVLQKAGYEAITGATYIKVLFDKPPQGSVGYKSKHLFLNRVPTHCLEFG